MKEKVNAILTLGASGARVSNGDPGSGFITNVYFCFVSPEITHSLTLKAPIATKVVCFSCLLKSVRSLYGKQCGPRSDCSYRSSLFWVHAICFYT